MHVGFECLIYLLGVKLFIKFNQVSHTTWSTDNENCEPESGDNDDMSHEESGGEQQSDSSNGDENKVTEKFYYFSWLVCVCLIFVV